MSAPIFTISGLRGIVGEDLVPETACTAAAAFGTLVRSGAERSMRVAVGRDCRTSGLMLTAATLSGLLSVGCEAVNLGICPTPTIPLLVSAEKLAGGIMITASHNPPQWNGLKFISAAGAFLNDSELRALKGIIRRSSFPRAAWNRLGFGVPRADAIDLHIGRIVRSPYFRNRARRRLKIGVDACNGAASVAALKLVRKLGSRPFELFCSPSNGGSFPRGPEPTADHLATLSAFVRKHKLDMGAAFDPDGDRFSCVDETGTPLGEEASVMLATDFVLQRRSTSRRPPTVVVNLSTTQGVDDVAARYGAFVYRSRVGEAAVVARMKQVEAVVGGEGNGGVIVPAINTARDGLVALAVLVQTVSDADRPLSEIARDLPHYFMLKDKATLNRREWPAIKDALRAEFKGAEFDLTDGLRIKMMGDGRRAEAGTWLHVRPSNTEPIIRVIIEAKSTNQAGRIRARVRRILRGERGTTNE